MPTNHLDQPRIQELNDLVTHATANLTACREAVKGLRAFRRNAQGLDFSLKALEEATTALRYHASLLDDHAKALRACIEPPPEEPDTLTPSTPMPWPLSPVHDGEAT